MAAVPTDECAELPEARLFLSNRAPQGLRQDSANVERTLPMMRSIVESSLKLRLLVVAIAVGVMVLGIGQLRPDAGGRLARVHPADRGDPDRSARALRGGSRAD